MQKCLVILEANYVWKIKHPCEPQLGKYALYPSLSVKEANKKVWQLLNITAYADGNHDLIELAETIEENALDYIPVIDSLAEHGLIEKVS